jgi:hypothetical protein
MVKPIETKYKGYRFRSRLEARWAVFFDALHVRYEYEKEGFDLGSGKWFLPDFYLVEQDCYLEIKPGNLFEIDRKQYVDSIVNTASLAQKQNCLLIFGNPNYSEYNIVGALRGSEVYGHFALGEKGKLWIIKENSATCLGPITDTDKLPSDDCTLIMEAYTKARQARFEHGETPD